jgi:hypothetical protein
LQTRYKLVEIKRHPLANSDLELSVVELLAEIARALVDRPEDVSVTAKAGGEVTLLRLRVDVADVGKIIGKQGRTARSLRTLLGAISVKVGHRYYLEILEDADREVEER